MQMPQQFLRVYQFLGLFTISDFSWILGNGRCCFPKGGAIKTFIGVAHISVGFNTNFCVYNSLNHTSMEPGSLSLSKRYSSSQGHMLTCKHCTCVLLC